jgi:hypothetical protein
MLAMGMIEIMDREGLIKAKLFRRMELSRVRITQIINLLKLSPRVIEKIKSWEADLKMIITERWLRGTANAFLH